MQTLTSCFIKSEMKYKVHTGTPMQ